MPEVSRRQFLHASAFGLPLASMLHLRAAAVEPRRVKSVILLYCWGGMSHIETFDPKPNAPAEYRGEFQPIPTNVTGIQVGEHMPRLAGQMDKLAVVRSMHHESTAHGMGMYWNWTGFPPPNPTVARNIPRVRADRPSIGPMIATFRRAPAGFPATVQLPYPMVDNNTHQAGENAGFLGQVLDPIYFRTSRGRPYGGVSRDLGAMVIQPADGVDSERFAGRQSLVQRLNRAPIHETRGHDHFRQLATDIVTSPRVQAAFNLDLEPVQRRDAYGHHICGQSMLQARRLAEAGVPVTTVICAAGDLNGSSGDHWDTHGDNFNRLKRDLLPPFDQGASALLADLSDRGMLDETMVVIFSEFGRTPLVRGNGRDHYPGVYSIALAGGGVRGGIVVGASDRYGAVPSNTPARPGDMHATIFEALGIPIESQLRDGNGRPHPLCEGRVLPVF